jgi:hypothetical protein
VTRIVQAVVTRCCPCVGWLVLPAGELAAVVPRATLWLLFAHRSVGAQNQLLLTERRMA